jgi:hypothetical protein
LLLEKCLAEHINSKSIVLYNILRVIKNLPISTKNAVVEIEKILSNLKEKSSSEEIHLLAEDLLHSWKDLEMVYKIPKRELEEITASLQKDGKRQKSNQCEEKFQSTHEHHRKDPSSKQVERSYSMIRVDDLKPKEDFSPALSWNQINPVHQRVSELAERHESIDSDGSQAGSSNAMSEDSIQQILDAAQEATRVAEEQQKLQQLKEKEQKKRLVLKKKEKHQQRKEKYKKLIENAIKAKEVQAQPIVSTEARQKLKAEVL